MSVAFESKWVTLNQLVETYRFPSDMCVNGSQVRAYVKTILMDSQFRANPKTYVTNWSILEDQLGYERFPQGPALEFFIKHSSYLP